MTDLEPRALTLKDRALSVAITDHATHTAAVELGLGIKALRDEAEAHHRPIIKATDAAHDAAIAAFRRIDDPLKEAQRILGSKVTAYQLELDRIALEEQTRKQQAENERAEREAQQAALDAIDEGASIEEVEVIATPQPVSVAVQAPPKVAGASKRDNWTCEVTDQMELVKAVAAGRVPILAVQPNQVFLNQQARALKGLFNYPGCRAKNTPLTAWGGRK